MSQPVGHKILIIDADELILLSLKSLAESEGFVVQTARSGAEALAKARAEQFEVFLLNLLMPGMSGFEICTALRALGANREPAIVMLTSRNTEANRNRGKALGVTRFLPRHIDPDVLLSVLQSIVAAR